MQARIYDTFRSLLEGISALYITTNTTANLMSKFPLSSHVTQQCLALVLMLASTVSANAADYQLCGPALVLPPRPTVEVMPSEPGETSIEADSADLIEDATSVLRGNVQVVRDTKQLGADEARYDKINGQLEASGHLQFWDQGAYISGTHGNFSIEEDITIVEQAKYLLQDSHAHGAAGVLTLEGSNILKARDARYSTCNPDDEVWVLEADSIHLDKTDDRGTARNVWVNFKGMPVFYSPYLSFPLSDARKSGFLTPSFGGSGNSGIEATVPYYFNIAPNFDATLATRAMSDRGVQLQGEFRYLFPWGEGQLGAEALADDKEFNDDRFALKFRHQNEFTDRIEGDLDFNWVSDSTYFEDLGSSLNISGQTHLQQRGDLRYRGDWFNARTRVQNYLTIDRSIASDDRPYKQLPQFTFNTTFRERNRELNFGAQAEAVSFDRRSSVTGVRWDLNPYVSFPIRSAATYIIPKAGLRYTGYNLDSTSAGQSDNPSRFLPDFSLDSGLFLDRPFSFAGKGYLQTLEPRLYYLYRPFDNQNDLPIFDTGEYSFNFAQLFRDDRFSGPDRIGDANQLTVALTSRILSGSGGEELLHASIGQIRYFRDRKITLPTNLRDTRSGSDIVAEVSASLNQSWRASAGTQYDTSASRTNKNTLSLRYQPDSRRVVNLAYRFVRDEVEQTDLSATWPLVHNWRAVGRWNYSLEGQRTLEAFAGFEYEGCCWGLRLVGRRYLTSASGEYNNAVFMQFELKGLAGVGNATEFLQKSIPGYQNEF